MIYMRRPRAESKAATNAKPWRKVVKTQALPFLNWSDELDCGHTATRGSHRDRPNHPKRRRCSKCPAIKGKS